MKLLLDTHLLLWAAGQPSKLSAAARKLLNTASNQLIFSTVSLWEIAIKHPLAPQGFRVGPRVLRRGLLENGYMELAITSEHAVMVDGLVTIHHDPFDRLLVAQVMVEGITLLTTDRQVARYPGPIRLA